MKAYRNLYKNIIYDIKNQLNEMARKSINRTIDKKLWLTVSSIISRNRSTEAENINPVNNDKDNLLQRYVASLLVMKKPCPNNIEDIGKLKTFKKVGYKFIDLGGTIQDIQKLYNENSETKNINDIQSTKQSQPNNITTSTNIEDSDDDFWGDKFNNSNNNSTSFLDDLEDDLDQTVYNELIPLDNTSSLIDVYYEVLNTNVKPKGFKLIKPNNINEYQYYIYTGANIEQNGEKLFKSLIKEYKWENIINPVFSTIHTCYDMHYRKNRIDFIDNQSNYNIKRYLPIDINSNTNIKKDISNIYPELPKNKRNILAPDNIYNDAITVYNKLNSIIENKHALKLFKSNSNISNVLISPDGGLMLYRIIYPEHIKYNSNNDTSYNYSYNFGTLDYNTGLQFEINVYKISYTYKYVLTFTGDINYNNILKDDAIKDIRSSHIAIHKNNAKIRSVFVKMLSEYAPMFKNYIGDKSPVEILPNGTYGIKNYIPYLTNNDTIITQFWGKRNGPEKRDKKQIGPKDIWYTIKGLTPTPNVVAQFKDWDDMFLIQQFDTQINNGKSLIIISLLSNGLKMFIERCKKKNIQLN